MGQMVKDGDVTETAIAMGTLPYKMAQM
jgi:hypothetical protein